MYTVKVTKNNIHKIYLQEFVITSYASSLLLWQYYTSLEDEQYKTLDIDSITIPEDKKKNWKFRVAFNTNFLRKKLVESGALTCVYCFKKNLIIDSPNKSILATADHFLPVAKGGLAFSENNLVVCCDKCNNKKADKVGYIDLNGNYKF